MFLSSPGSVCGRPCADLYCIVDAGAALMDGYLWKRSHESIKAAIVGSFTVQIPRMDEMPHSIGKFVKKVL